MRSTTWWLLTVALVCGTGAVQAQDIDTKAAQTSVETWLALVDKEAYADSWKEAASGFRSKVSEDTWQMLVAAARGPFGKLKQRSISKTTATRALPGVPDGEYVVFQFATAFEQKQAAVETVTAVKDTDGTWRVGGYFVK